MVIKVRPAEGDVSVVSFSYDDIHTERGDEGWPRAGPERTGVVESQAPARRKTRFGKFLTSWITTVPDAVGITGIKYIVSSQYHVVRRLLWLLVVCAGIVVLCYHTVNRAVLFASNPKSMDIEIKYDSELTFPAVTICNYNNYRNVNGSLESHPFGELLREHSSVETLYTGFIADFTRYESLLGGVNTTALYLEFAHQMDYGQMFLSGQWGSSTPLGPANFTRVFTDFGICYTFNYGQHGEKVLKQRVAGKAHGLSVGLNMQQYYYYYNKRNQTSAGFMVAVHDQKDVPEVDSLGVGVAPGLEARIGIRVKQATNLPPPHGVCGTKELQYFSSYTRTTCRQECLINFVLEACGCVEPYMAVSSQMRVCDPLEVFSCVYAETARFQNEGECDCPVPCALTSYSTSLSYARCPSDFLSQEAGDFSSSRLGINLSDDFNKDNVVQIQVFFEEMSVEHFIQQEAYTFFAFVCDIGGALGFWLGGSILTIVEILDHLTHIMFIPGPPAFQHASV